MTAAMPGRPGSSTPDATAPDFVVVDVETACARVGSICQIGIVGFRNGVAMFEYETLVDPRDRFSSFNTRIHGITGDRVRGAPTFGDIHDVIDGHLCGRITVAHSSFDKGALAAACTTHACASIETTWLDSVRVARRAWPELASHRLNVLAGFLGLRHRHHDALSDAHAAGMVIVRAIEHTGIDLAGWLTPPAAARKRARRRRGSRRRMIGSPDRAIRALPDDQKFARTPSANRGPYVSYVIVRSSKTE